MSPFLIDTNGCTLSRNMCHPLTLLPQREPHPFRLDWLLSMHRRLYHNRSQRPSTTIRHYNIRLQIPLPRSLVSRLRRRVHRCRVDNHIFRCAEVWKKEYALVYFRVLVDWGN